MAALIRITVEGETKIHVFAESEERTACGYAVVDYCESLDGVSDVQPFKVKHKHYEGIVQHKKRSV